MTRFDDRLTKRAKQALQYAQLESAQRSVLAVQPADILLGLLHGPPTTSPQVPEHVRAALTQPSVAYVVLTELGLKQPQLRNVVADNLQAPSPSAKNIERPFDASAVRAMQQAMDEQ